MSRYEPSLDELRALVDAELTRFLDRSARQLDDNRLLIDELRRVIAAGGKRLRPAFCYWGYRAAGADHDEQIVAAAAGLELLHTFALVHDDIMDGAELRRGQPTVHALHGVSVGVLAGDLALVLADACLFAAGFDASRMTAAFDAYQLMRQEVIAGQYLDVRAEDDAEIAEAEARRIAVLKSGRYSVEKPLVIGARLALAPDELVARLSAFGEPLGEAFQFRDDLLGTFGDASVGKPIDSDIKEGKRNVLYARTAAALVGVERDLFVRRWGAGPDLGDDEIEVLRSLVEKSGARDSVEALLGELAGHARAVLANADLPDDAESALEDLVDLAIYRRV